MFVFVGAGVEIEEERRKGNRKKQRKKKRVNITQNVSFAGI